MAAGGRSPPYKSFRFEVLATLHSPPEPEKLITKDFLALNAIVFLTYCNIAVFFEFHHYLGTLPIDEKWFGLLIALFSVTVLVIRPIISPLLHPDNAKRWIGISCFWVLVSLLLYNVAHGFWTMAVVRLIHGAAYVVMATAVVSRLVGSIPREKSAQAFGLISVITLLPYAVMPPILGPLTRWAGSFDNVPESLVRLDALVLSAAITGRKPACPTRARHLGIGSDGVMWLRISRTLAFCR